MQIHQPKAGGAILLRVHKLAGLFDAVVDVLGAAAPGPLAVLLALDVVTGAHGQFTLGAVPRDGPGQRGRIDGAQVGRFAVPCEKNWFFCDKFSFSNKIKKKTNHYRLNFHTKFPIHV